ncbi:hypothetical protein M5G07_11075 [Serratia symbiotica]|nr:hypothetical protein [Serratia symbiotica]
MHLARVSACRRQWCHCVTGISGCRRSFTNSHQRQDDLKAGQAITFRQDAFGTVAPLRYTEPAWPSELLQADNLPLSEFIEKLSAYHSGYLGCDHTVATLTITGTFPLHDTDMELEMLTNVLPVQLNHQLLWGLMVAPRDG